MNLFLAEERAANPFWATICSAGEPNHFGLAVYFPRKLKMYDLYVAFGLKLRNLSLDNLVFLQCCAFWSEFLKWRTRRLCFKPLFASKWKTRYEPEATESASSWTKVTKQKHKKHPIPELSDKKWSIASKTAPFVWTHSSRPCVFALLPERIKETKEKLFESIANYSKKLGTF